MNTKMTEQEFIDAFRAYNENIFNFVYLRVRSRDIAQDLTQDAFMKVWNSRSKFDPAKSSLKTWIFKVTKNHLIDFFRKNKNYVLPLDETDLYGSEINNDKDIDLEFIYSKLRELKSDEQTLIILKYIEGLSNEEISLIIDKNINSTKVSISRALYKLKRIINISSNAVQ